VLDADRDKGPVVFTSAGHKRHEPFAIKYGEGDLALVQWAKFLLESRKLTRDMSLVVRTTDTDVMPTFFSYLTGGMSLGRQQHVLWNFSYQTSGSLSRMLEGMHRVTGLMGNEFAAACILCGNDFFEKKWLFHRFGWDRIVWIIKYMRILQPNWLQTYMTRTWDDVRRVPTMDPGDEQKLVVKENKPLRTIRNILRLAYSMRLGLKHSPQRPREPATLYV